MADLLSRLVEDGVVDEVISRLKSGKEADIYLVQHAGEIVAAKLYKDREFRSFKNNSAYKEGRVVRNSRTQRAMEKGSRFGQAAEEDAWKAQESEALTKLFAVGVRVPKPYIFYEGVLLMEAVIDPEGHPAPRLMDAHIPKERAVELYTDLRAQVVRILMCDLIHGDLSPYNVLLAWNGPTVIDFPQVVGAAHNSQAEFFFTRDLETIRKFFAAIDPSLNARASDAQEIWRAYTRRELTVDFVPTGRAPMAPPPQRTFVPGAQRQGGPGNRQGAPKQQQGNREQGRPSQGQRLGPAVEQRGAVQQQGNRGGPRGEQRGQRPGPTVEHRGDRPAQQHGQRNGPAVEQRGAPQQQGHRNGPGNEQRGAPQQQGPRSGPAVEHRGVPPQHGQRAAQAGDRSAPQQGRGPRSHGHAAGAPPNRGQPQGGEQVNRNGAQPPAQGSSPAAPSAEGQPSSTGRRRRRRRSRNKPVP